MHIKQACGRSLENRILKNYVLFLKHQTGERKYILVAVFFLRRFEEPKRSLKIVQRSLKICFYNSVNKAKYAQEQ